MTKRQHEVLDFIRAFKAEHSYDPSYKEIGDGVGLRSQATVHDHMVALAEAGLIQRKKHRSRSIEFGADAAQLRGYVRHLIGVASPTHKKECKTCAAARKSVQ